MKKIILCLMTAVAFIFFTTVEVQAATVKKNKSNISHAKKIKKKPVDRICSGGFMIREVCCDGTVYTVGWYNIAWWCESGVIYDESFYIPTESACWYSCV